MYEHLPYFVQYLQYNRQYTEATFAAYRSDILAFCTWYEREHGTVAPITVSRIVIEQYIFALHVTGKAKSSIRRSIATLRQFFLYLLAMGHITVNPMEGILTPKKDKRLPKILTKTQMTALLNQDASTNVTVEAPLVLRDYALVELLYGSGLRISEALSLCVQDFSKKQTHLCVRGKGRKERIVPLTRISVTRIVEWLDVRPLFALDSEDAIFVGKHGKRLHRKEAQRILKRLTNNVQLPSVSPHAMRHSFATHLLENGANTKSVQELLGHTKLSTTQHYTKLSLQNVLEQYHKYHPVLPSQNKKQRCDEE